MSAPLVKGWCPGALRPMLSGDGLLLRVRPRGGHLSQREALALADLSRDLGNGLIDLSARGNLQIRGLDEKGHRKALARLAELNLLDPDATGEARRNVLVTPFWQAGDGTSTLALALEEALTRTGTLALPGKFGFAVDTGSTPILRAASADIRIERAADGTLLLCADGGETGKPITPDTAVAQAIALAHWWQQAADMNAPRRMRGLLAAGIALPDGFTVPIARDAALVPTPGPTPAGVLLGVAFGQIQADSFAALADLADLRLTPWRMVLLEGVEAMPHLPSFITDPADPMLRVAACPGAPACAQGLAPVRDLARSLAPHLPEGLSLHVSGCAKGCAHPGPADVTLTARADGFALARNATAAMASTETALSPQALADPALLMTRI